MTLPNNPLVIPELLETVLSFTNTNTLKSCRLVSKFWNTQSGHFLPTSCWIKVFSSLPDTEGNNNRIEDLQLTLEGSNDPSKFFGRLQVHGHHPQDQLEQLLQTYGKCLTTFAYRYRGHPDKCNEVFDHRPPYFQKLILKILSQWCPELEELRFNYNDFHRKVNLTDQNVPFDLDGPLNLKRIKLKVHFTTESFLTFWVELIRQSTKLKWLKLYKVFSSDSVYEKVIALKNITQNLKYFAWITRFFLDDTNVVSNTSLSPELRNLRINLSTLDPTGFPKIIDSVAENLTTLSLKNCSFLGWDEKDSQLYIFKIVVQKLKKLETLNIGFLDGGDDFFSNAEDLTDPPHTNLKRLILPWYIEQNIEKLSSLNTLVKWFPNLNLLSLAFGNGDEHSGSMGRGIKFQEAVRVLSGLKQLKNLSLRVYSSSSPGDLQETLHTLKDIPSLECCTLVEFGEIYNEAEFGRRFSKSQTSYYKFADLKPYLTDFTENLKIIRLIGFKLVDEESMLVLAKENGVSLELFTNCHLNSDKGEGDYFFTSSSSNVNSLPFDPIEYLN